MADLEIVDHESDARLRLLLNSTAEGIYGIDMRGNCTFCNASCLRLLRYKSVEELLGKNMHWQIHGKYADGSLFPVEDCRIFKAFRQGTGAYVDDEVLWRSDGTSFPAEYHSYPQYKGDVIIGAVVTFLDISERKAMEAALREKSAALDHYFAAALDLLCIADVQGNFIRLNPEWEHVLGYSLDDLVGHSFLELVHPDDLEGTLAALTRLKSQEEILSFENRYRCKSGEYRWIEWRSRPDGDLVYAVARDVTERKSAEEKVGALLAEKEMLLREVHHRIKNNMNTIRSLLVLQAETVNDTVAKVALEDASNRVWSMTALYERLYQAQDFMEMSVKDYLPVVIEQIVENFSGKARIDVKINIDDFILHTKQLQPLGIIVNELTTNIMKYAFSGRSEGVVEISAILAGNLVTVEVKDDGNGIPESVDSENSTGFGLTLVRALTQQLHGTISIMRGNGTKLILRFPR